MKLNRKISLSSGIYTTTMILLIGLLAVLQWTQTLKDQMEYSARDLAVAVAQMESIQYNLTLSNGSIPIQRKAEKLKLSTRTQYIHILNREGRYYAHTFPGELGKTEDDAFLTAMLIDPPATVILRRKTSSLLPSIEAVAPVYYQGELAGLIITGMLNGRIYQDIRRNMEILVLVLILAVFASLYSSAFLSRNIKKSMHGMEPGEISRLLGQRAMTLENLKEGIVTIDQDGKIIYFNASAEKLACLTEASLGSPSEYFFFGEEFKTCRKNRRTCRAKLISPCGISLQSHLEPILSEGQFLGATVLFEDLTEVRARAEELTGIKQINEGLRAQNHEFLNKLHTISGLIQLEEYDEAIHFITGISHNRREMTSLLTSRIKDPSVAGLLLGKYNMAQEQKTEFVLEEGSMLSDSSGQSDLINLILGNLIENSLEELRRNWNGLVSVFLKEEEDSIHLRVLDTGGGIQDTENVFKRGVSSKGTNRGLGLYLVQERLQHAGGAIKLESRPGKTLFSVNIPRVKERT